MEISSQDIRQRYAIADLLTLESILSTFFQESEAKLWHPRGQPAPVRAWTLQQTLAHMASAAELYLSVLQHTFYQTVPAPPIPQQRQDLQHFNQQEILRRQDLQVTELLTILLQSLTKTSELAQQLVPAQFTLPVPLPLFNRPLTVLELLEMQITHPGMIHAAQMALPAGKTPLWTRYDADFMHRMLVRFFRLMALIYWPERGGNLDATVQFLIAGAGGGEWHVSIGPTGGQFGEGRSSKSQVTIWAANADAFCQWFTGGLSTYQAIFKRKLFVRGNPLLAKKLPYLFSPT
jgi:uncharacterized damage-inducible protein DinB